MAATKKKLDTTDTFAILANNKKRESVQSISIDELTKAIVKRGTKHYHRVEEQHTAYGTESYVSYHIGIFPRSNEYFLNITIMPLSLLEKEGVTGVICSVEYVGPPANQQIAKNAAECVRLQYQHAWND